MHAVVVKVEVQDPRGAEERLKQEVVPRVSQLPGFVAGYWLGPREGNEGLSVIVFESEDAARAAADSVPRGIPEGVALRSVETRQVVAHA